MYSENLLNALRDLIRAEIATELDRRAAVAENEPQQAKAHEQTAEQPEAKAEQANNKAEQTRDPIVPLEGRGPEPTDKDRADLTAALKALIVEQNDAAQEFRQLVRDGKQCACSACREWGEFEDVVDFINYRRGLKNGRA